jgi:hypothetical protein
MKKKVVKKNNLSMYIKLKERIEELMVENGVGTENRWQTGVGNVPTRVGPDTEDVIPIDVLLYQLELLLEDDKCRHLFCELECPLSCGLRYGDGFFEEIEDVLKKIKTNKRSFKSSLKTKIRKLKKMTKRRKLEYLIKQSKEELKENEKKLRKMS